MATLVCFHAHPDDEAISTGGLMAKAAAAGHRVVLVTATRGERGEPQPGVLLPGEELWERRWSELTEAAAILGAEEPRWLGYQDSGMIGDAANDNPRCFWQADPTEAIDRLAVILNEVSANVVTIYDPNGGYGHPDHIQVHNIGKAAAAAAGVTHVYEATFNREHTTALMADADFDDEGVGEFDVSNSGTPQAEIAYRIDVDSVIGLKRDAIVAHRSQIGPDDFFLSMPPDRFRETSGTEWFNIPDEPQTHGPTEVNLLPGLGQDTQ